MVHTAEPQRAGATRAQHSTQADRMHAFSTHAAVTRRRLGGSGAVCRRRTVVARKRPRGARGGVRAMFIWSNDGLFGDDEKMHSSDSADGEGAGAGGGGGDEDGEEVRDLNGTENGYEHPVFGRSWGASLGETNKNEASVGARKLLDALRHLTKGPDDVDGIRARTSEEAADAFRRIVMGIFGTVPGDSFEIIVNTDQSGVSRLMQSALATGYALRNAEWRMTVSDALGTTQLAADAAAKTDAPVFLRDVPRRGAVRITEVGGTVHWWDGDREERCEMEAREYVSKLEAENDLLRERLNAAQVHGSNANKLLDYMRTVSPEKIAALQKDMSEDALETFKVLIKNVLGGFTPEKVQISYSTSRDYLGQLSFWCLLVGYHVRNLEKKLEMSRMLELIEPVVAPKCEDT